MSGRQIPDPGAGYVGVRNHMRAKRRIMGTTPIDDDLDPLHQSCLSGCHCGSLICCVHHEAKQIAIRLFQQDVTRRVNTILQQIYSFLFFLASADIRDVATQVAAHDQ